MSTPYRSIKQMVIDQIKHMIDNRIQRRMRSDYDDYDDYDENREYYNGAIHALEDLLTYVERLPPV